MPKLRQEYEMYGRDAGFDMYIAYDSSNRTEYVGLAYPKTATSTAGWQIYKLTYDATSGGVQQRRYADGNDSFDNIWDNHASLDYTDI